MLNEKYTSTAVWKNQSRACDSNMYILNSWNYFFLYLFNVTFAMSQNRKGTLYVGRHQYTQMSSHSAITEKLMTYIHAISYTENMQIYTHEHIGPHI